MVKFTTPERWYQCPVCGQRLFTVSKDAVIRGMQYKCKKCKRIIDVSLEPKNPIKGS